MLNVAKLSTGQERYYLDSVASAIEDYYLGTGEETGRWTGRGSELLALGGVVDAEVLHRVLEGRDPGSGVRFTQARKDRVPGFDLTFSAPKSVSVLWALTDPDVSREVRDAHDSAVDAALRWMECEARRSRRGVDGTEHLVGHGFVAAKFFHRTSRAGDPQLHTHPGREPDAVRRGGRKALRACTTIAPRTRSQPGGVPSCVPCWESPAVERLRRAC